MSITFDGILGMGNPAMKLMEFARASPEVVGAGTKAYLAKDADPGGSLPSRSKQHASAAIFCGLRPPKPRIFYLSVSLAASIRCSSTSSGSQGWNLGS